MAARASWILLEGKAWDLPGYSMTLVDYSPGTPGTIRRLATYICVAPPPALEVGCWGSPARHVLPGSPPPQPLGGEGAWEPLPLPLGSGGEGGSAGFPSPGAGLESLGGVALAVWGLLALAVIATIAVYAALAFSPRGPPRAAPAASPGPRAPEGSRVPWSPYPIPGDLLELRARLRRAAEELGLPRGATGLEAALASGDKSLLDTARLYYERLFGGRGRGGS